MSINDHLSILRCGFGYDSDIICKTPQSLKNKFGYFAYFIAGILFALRLKKKMFQFKIDEDMREINASSIIFANASNMYKNLVSVAKNSTLDDGLIDIFILKTTNPVIFFFEFLGIVFNIKRNSKNVEFMQAQNILINNNWQVCHIDGEKVNLKEDIYINIIKNSVNVFTYRK
jgi:diacylglycerol kinase (ATP)